MSVDTQHPQYKEYASTWQFLRDVIAGDDAIKAQGTVYVPKLSEQTPTEYDAMLNRPVFEGYTARTLDGLTGLVFSKDPQIEAPTSLENLFDNIDLGSKSLTDLAQDTTDEVLTVGRVGLLADMASIDTTDMTAADVEALNIRPYVKMYDTESIINWRYENVNNKQVLTLVVLKEVVEEWINEFERDTVTQYRVLSLTEGVYTQRIFKDTSSDNQKQNFVEMEMFTPKMNGNLINEIPFVVITPTSLSIDPAKPPLYDMAKVNLTHFKTNVDYYHGMHFTALPTPYGAGVQMADNATIGIGSTSFHMFPDPNAKLEYLEFKGDGLGTLEREKTALKESMVVLGSNMLQSDKKVAESTNTVAMRNAGQNATLISVADTVSRGIEKVLNIINLWNGGSEEVTYRLNTDYNLTEMDAQTITALTSTWMNGGLSDQELFNNFQKGEIIKDGKTYEEHKTEIEEATPALTVSPIKENSSTSTLDSIRNKLGL